MNGRVRLEPDRIGRVRLQPDRGSDNPMPGNRARQRLGADRQIELPLVDRQTERHAALEPGGEPREHGPIDGPQLDDIRGIQGFYGDVREKSNAGQGNDTAPHASTRYDEGITGLAAMQGQWSTLLRGVELQC